MKSLRLPVLAALFMLVSGALVATQIENRWAIIAVMLLAGVASAVVLWLTGNNDDDSSTIAPPAPLVPRVEKSLFRQAHFQQVIDSLDFPILTVRNGVVVAANRLALDLLGQFIVDADIRTAIRHPAAADLLAPDSENNGQTIALTGIGRPGESWIMRAVTLETGDQVVMLTDVTEREALDRMRADFVANASHELRTPLAAVLGYVETLRDPAAGGDAATRERFLSIAEKEARRMQKLVEDLMSISRIEAGGSGLPQERVDMVELTRMVASELSAAGSGRPKDIQITPFTGSLPPIVRGDRAQLSQLLHNLISNAMKYGRPDTPITVSLTVSDANMVELDVVDQGEGIAQDHLPRLTERFYRVDSARSRELGGTGLGLAIVRHIVNRHRGRLEIDSEIGVGTNVHVRLPRVRENN